MRILPNREAARFSIPAGSAFVLAGANGQAGGFIDLLIGFLAGFAVSLMFIVILYAAVHVILELNTIVVRSNLQNRMKQAE